MGFNDAMKFAERLVVGEPVESLGKPSRKQMNLTDRSKETVECNIQRVIKNTFPTRPTVTAPNKSLEVEVRGVLESFINLTDKAEATALPERQLRHQHSHLWPGFYWPCPAQLRHSSVA